MICHSALIFRFASFLGWHGVEKSEIKLTADISGVLPVGTVITCWSTNDLKFFLQINQFRPGEFGKYNVSVVAKRYNIGPMDFAPCEFNTDEEAIAEAERLYPIFARQNFRDRNWQRKYLADHPDKLLRGRKKWRGWKAKLCT